MSDETVAFIGIAAVDVRNLIVRELGLTLGERYSDEWGGDYWHTAVRERPSVQVFTNFEDEDGVLYLEGHPEFTSVVACMDLTDDQAAELVRMGGIPIESIGIVSADSD